MGKLSSEELLRLLACVRKDSRVIVPPSVGYDSGVHLIGDHCLVVSTDPCIDVPQEWFGWLLVHYAASDVALFGAKPQFCTINLLGSPATKPSAFRKAMSQACAGADEIGMAIVTGHTGTYDGLSKLVGVCTAYGTVDRSRLITPGDAKPEDVIFCIKPVGLEVIVNLTLMRKKLAERLFGTSRGQELSRLVKMQSCVKEAALLASLPEVHAMHDATEGGIVAALNELAEASGVGFRIEYEKLPLPGEMDDLRRHFRLSDKQVLGMSSTGTIIAAVDPERQEEVAGSLRRNDVEASIIGVFEEDRRHILLRNGKPEPFPRKSDDPYVRILSGKV